MILTGMTGWRIRAFGLVTSYQQCLLMDQVMKEVMCFLVMFIYSKDLFFCALMLGLILKGFVIFVRSSDYLCGFEPDGWSWPACAALHRPIHSW